MDIGLDEINESTEYQDYDKPGKKHWELPKISHSNSSVDLLSEPKREQLSYLQVEDDAPYETIKSTQPRKLKQKAKISNSSSMKVIAPVSDIAPTFQLMAVQSIEPKKL